MSMIEKMARAIRKSILIKANEVAELANIRSKILSDEEIERKVDALWPCDVDAAKAALECLKDPTEEMTSAGLDCKAWAEGSDSAVELLNGAYIAMINAALEGK